MQDGINNIIERAERTIRDMAAYGLSSSAKDIKELIQYAKALDKNQKALIKLMLRYKRANDTYEHLVKRIYQTLFRELKHVENVWTTEEGDEIESE